MKILIDEEEFNELRENAANGGDWFNSYSAVDDFLIKQMDNDFPTDYLTPEENTIEAIELYVLERIINHKKRDI